MFKLILESGNNKREFILKGEKLTVGRATDNDIIIPDPLASRHHLEFFEEGNKVKVSDLNSSNGTYIDGENVEGTITFNTNQVLVVGKSKFVLKKLDDSFEEEKDEKKIDDNSSLFIINQLGKILLHTNTLNDLFESVLELITQIIQSEITYVFYYKEKQVVEDYVKNVNEPLYHFVPSPMLLEILKNLSEPQLFFDQNIIEKMEIDACCILVAPFISENKFLGGFILVNKFRETHEFNSADSDILNVVASMISIGIQVDMLRENIKQETIYRNNLERFHSPDVVNLILKQTSEKKEVALDVKKIETTIFFSDIKDFTPLSERLEPEELADLLNEYFDIMTNIIFKYHGSVNKYIGDAIMALFGAPFSYGNDPKFAVTAALEMLEELKVFNKRVAENKRISIRIGINTGMVVAGNIGSKSRMEYTVLGDTVNVASRLEGVAPENGLLIGENTYFYIKDLFQFKDVGYLKLKGKEKKVKAFQVIKPNF